MSKMTKKIKTGAVTSEAKGGNARGLGSAINKSGLILYGVLILAGFLAGKATPTKNPNYSQIETAIMADHEANRVVCVRNAATEGEWTPVYNLGK